MKKLIATLSFTFLMAMGLVNSASAVGLEGLSIGVSASYNGFYGEGTEDEETCLWFERCSAGMEEKAASDFVEVWMQANRG